MSEFLSPGIFIEEVNAGGQTIQAVGTSTMAIVGWTQMGTPDQAALVTGPSSYQRQFGDFVKNTLVPISVNAFFSNGGTRCYVVRVCPTDAVIAASAVTDSFVSEVVGTGTGSTPITLTHTVGAATAGKETSTVGPFIGHYNDHWDVSIDEGASQVYTFRGTRGFKTGAGGVFAGVAGTIVVRVDEQAPAQDITVTFAGTENSEALALAVFNAQLLGAHAIDNGAGQIKLESDRYGTSSEIRIVSGTGALLTDVGMAVGLGTAGTVTVDKDGGGFVSKSIAFLDSMTATEIAVAFGNPTGGTLVGDFSTNKLTLATSTVGGSPKGVQVKNTSTNSLNFDNNEHNGTVGGAISAPLNPGHEVISWLASGTPVSAEAVVWSPDPNGVLLGPFTGVLLQRPITKALLTIHWKEATVDKTATLNPVGNVLGGANAANVSSATINITTGQIVITFAVAHAPDAASLTVDYTPAVAKTVTDNGLGAFIAAGVSGTVDYATGAISITFTGASVVPYNGDSVTLDYQEDQWTLAAASPGAWGNGLKFTLQGNDNFFVFAPPGTAGSGTWSKFNVTVSLFNSTTLKYDVKETFDEISFVDPTDVMFAPLVINDASNFVVLTLAGTAAAVPSTFVGEKFPGEVVGVGNGVTKAFSTSVSNNVPSLVKGSVVLNYTVGGVAKSAAADADGNFAAIDLDPTKTNTVDYATGLLTLNFFTAPDNLTNVTVDYIQSPSTNKVDYFFATGSDGTLVPLPNSQFGRNQFSGPVLTADKKGLFALDRVDEMLQLIIPDFAGDIVVQGDMIAYSEVRRDVFSILATPKGRSATQAVDYVRLTLAQFSKYAAIYWPWIDISDPLANGRTLTIPVVAHVAGIYARTDISKNVGKAPGGTVDGALRSLIGLEHNPDKGERDTVYPAKINPLINTPQTGMAVWGVRTLAADSAWKYINAVRLFIFVEKSVFNSTHQFVFENIGATLYSQIKTQLDGFLLNLFGQGYFAGATPTQGFSVKVDSDNNPPDVVNAGQVVVDVAIAPNKPAEFVRFRFSQKILS